MKRDALPLPDAPHARPAENVLADSGSRPQGLTRIEASARLVRHGRNALPRPQPPGGVKIFLRQFLSPLIYILLFAAAVSLFLGDWSDAGFIAAVLLINAVIGGVQEYGAEKSAEALRALVTSKALVTRGGGSGVVVSTGVRTRLGQIATSVTAADSAKPPLLVRMDRFTRRIALAIGIAVIFLGAVSIARGRGARDVFFMAVALAVSAIPEGLPVALTVALSIGAGRMSRRKVIARRLVAVEALGSCTFIASDKTGTLTLNEMTARKVLFAGHEPWDVTGEGTVPEGDALVPPLADAVGGRALVERLAVAVSLCNDGFLGRRD